MCKIITVEDQPNIVPTKNFPLMGFPFEYFNPVQSRVLEFYDSDANLLIAANTSAGKTVVAEIVLSYENQVRKSKGMYISPLRALGQEKIDDWTNEEHPFSKLNLSIVTGDYRLTPDRQEELMQSDIILMTSEMLNSATRNFTSNKNSFLYHTNTLVIDEMHFVGSPGRGDKCEVAIMKMVSLNPKCRLVGLSATLPNVDELAGWMTEITQRDTIILKSKYRPCPLKTHYIPYNDKVWKYEYKEKEKIYTAIDIVNSHPHDKFLIFTHGKETGKRMCEVLESAGIETEFHNSALDKAKRVKLENRFKNDPNFRVIVATSTISAGCNLPARRVVILGVHRGLTEVDSLEIIQECGRAGRPKYDPAGDAYILLPKSDQGKHVLRLTNLEPVRSQLVSFGADNYKTLTFHIVSEIFHGTIKTINDFNDWYKKSLAYYQNKKISDDTVSEIFDKMCSKNIIRIRDGIYEVTPIGKVASLFYYSPYDVSDLVANFSTLFEHKRELDIEWIAVALAKVDSSFIGIASNSEWEQIEPFVNKIQHEVRDNFGKWKNLSRSILKSAYVYHCILNGYSNSVLASAIQASKMDCDRLVEVLKAIDGMVAKWGKGTYLKKLGKRLSYGVDWDLLDLCSVGGIGKVKATKLWNIGVRNVGDILNKPKSVQSALRCSDSVLNKIVESAKKSLT